MASSPTLTRIQVAALASAIASVDGAALFTPSVRDDGDPATNAAHTDEEEPVFPLERPRLRRQVAMCFYWPQNDARQSEQP